MHGGHLKPGRNRVQPHGNGLETVMKGDLGSASQEFVL